MIFLDALETDFEVNLTPGQAKMAWVCENLSPKSGQQSLKGKTQTLYCFSLEGARARLSIWHVLRLLLQPQAVPFWPGEVAIMAHIFEKSDIRVCTIIMITLKVSHWRHNYLVLEKSYMIQVHLQISLTLTNKFDTNFK